MKGRQRNFQYIKSCVNTLARIHYNPAKLNWTEQTWKPGHKSNKYVCFSPLSLPPLWFIPTHFRFRLPPCAITCEICNQSRWNSRWGSQTMWQVCVWLQFLVGWVLGVKVQGAVGSINSTFCCRQWHVKKSKSWKCNFVVIILHLQQKIAAGAVEKPTQKKKWKIGKLLNYFIRRAARCESVPLTHIPISLALSRLTHTIWQCV